MAGKYWLLKTEPEEYSWARLVREGRGRWDGVRNLVARNHLRAMKVGDLAFIYHTGKEKSVVGVATVVREHYPDPTAKVGDFSAVDVSPLQELSEPVSLARVKADSALAEMVLARVPRLSVQPVTPKEFRRVLSMSGTKLAD